jgi:hypothetical protein
VGDGDFNLQIVDVLIPSAPRVVGGLNTFGEGNGVAVAGDYVYLTALNHGLQVFNRQCR